MTIRGVLGYQRGTTTERAGAPSAPTLREGVLAAALFAGAGYALVAPDHLGLGASTDVHPYLVAATTAATTIDLLCAARDLAADHPHLPWSSRLHLTGFSPGRPRHRGHPARPRTPPRPDPARGCRGGRRRSVRPGGGLVPDGADRAHRQPVALSRPPRERLQRDLPAAAGVPAAGAVRDHGAAALRRQPRPGLRDGRLPDRPRDLFRPEFLARYDQGRGHWFVDALRANDALDWAPRAPIRLYYGDADLDVDPSDSRNAARRMTAAGGNATAVSVGPHDHGGAVLHALPLVRDWFDRLSAPP